MGPVYSQQSTPIQGMNVACWPEATERICATACPLSAAQRFGARVVLNWAKMTHLRHARWDSCIELMEICGFGFPVHSGLMLASLITLPHFSVSATMSLPKSAGARLHQRICRGGKGVRPCAARH